MRVVLMLDYVIVFDVVSELGLDGCNAMEWDGMEWNATPPRA